MNIPHLIKSLVRSRPLMSLEALARKYGTDKGSVGHGYMQHYQKHLAASRYKQVRLLEIGVYQGGSLRAWKEYFWRGRVYGIDINSDCKQYEQQGIEIFIGDQSDSKFLREVCDRVGEDFDIIIDDGSHVNPLTLASFNFLFDSLRPGGMYVIEDLHCSYENDPFFSNTRKEMTDFFLQLINSVDLNCRPEILEKIGWKQNFDRLSPELKSQLTPLERHVASIHFYPSMCFIMKREA